MSKTHYEIIKKSFEDVGIKFVETNYSAGINVNGDFPELMGLLIKDKNVEHKLIEHLFTKNGKHFMVNAL